MSEEVQLDFSYDYLVQNVCRFCFIKIEADHPLQSTEIIEKMEECLNIHFTEDIPNGICKMCELKVEQFYKFKKRCQESHRMLLQFKELKTVKLENKEYHADHTDNMSDEVSLDREIKPKNEKRRRKTRSESWCYLCLMDFKTTEFLNNHRKEQHKNDSGCYKCLGCNKVFQNRRQCISHERLFCRGLKNGYKCRACEIFLPTRREYENHDQQHKNNMRVTAVSGLIFKCDTCEIIYNSRNKLIKHLKTHENPRKFVCESCGRVFSRRDYLKKHKFTHSNIKKYSCTFCTYRSNQKSALTIHLRKHTGEKPFSCDNCSYQTVSSGNLKAHKQKHSGLKQYECSACDKRFVYKKSLDMHISCAHISQHFSCECGAFYTTIRSLRRHQSAKECQKDTQCFAEQKLRET